jgi:hypothetical protein
VAESALSASSDRRKGFDARRRRRSERRAESRDEPQARRAVDGRATRYGSCRKRMSGRRRQSRARHPWAAHWQADGVKRDVRRRLLPVTTAPTSHLGRSSRCPDHARHQKVSPDPSRTLQDIESIAPENAKQGGAVANELLVIVARQRLVSAELEQLLRRWRTARNQTPFRLRDDRDRTEILASGETELGARPIEIATTRFEVRPSPSPGWTNSPDTFGCNSTSAE